MTVNPGYPTGSSQLIVRESDLRGHIGRAETDPSSTRTAPPTNENLHLGVARKVPRDPEDGPDLALGIAYRIVRGDYERERPAEPPTP